MQSSKRVNPLKMMCGILFAALFHLAAVRALLHDHITLPPIEAGHSVVMHLLKEEKRSSAAPVLMPLDIAAPQVTIVLPQPELPLGKFVLLQPMVTIGAKFSPEVALSVPAAEYPANLREFVETYRVEVTVQILEDGTIGGLHIEKSDGNEVLDNFVIAYAAKHWRFVPSMSDGEPVMSWKTVLVEITAKEMLVRS